MVGTIHTSGSPEFHQTGKHIYGDGRDGPCLYGKQPGDSAQVDWGISVYTSGGLEHQIFLLKIERNNSIRAIPWLSGQKCQILNLYLGHKCY